jgi:hypothetical protein
MVSITTRQVSRQVLGQKGINNDKQYKISIPNDKEYNTMIINGMEFTDYGSEGWGFESLQGHLIIRHLQALCGCLFFDPPSSRQVLGGEIYIIPNNQGEQHSHKSEELLTNKWLIINHSFIICGCLERR